MKKQKGSRLMTITGIMTVVLSVTSSIYLKVDFTMLVMCAVVGLFVFGKMSLSMMFSRGWKVFNRKTLLGMPIVIFTFYCILFVLLGGLWLSGTNLNEDFGSAETNIRSFVISAAIALVGTIIMWYAGVNQWTARGSEYSARLELEQKGYSPQEIEQKIQSLRTKGLIE